MAIYDQWIGGHSDDIDLIAGYEAVKSVFISEIRAVYYKCASAPAHKAGYMASFMTSIIAFSINLTLNDNAISIDVNV